MALNFQFEVEHIFAKALYGEFNRAAFLRSLGYEREMRGNKIGLLSHEETVAKLQGVIGPAKGLADIADKSVEFINLARETVSHVRRKALEVAEDTVDAHEARVDMSNR